MKFFALALALSTLIEVGTVSLAQTSQGTDHSDMQMSNESIAGAVHTKAIINSLNDDMANVTHDPIPEIGWPAMTMDLALSPNAQFMGDVSEGDAVTLMLIKGDDGMYAIGGIMAE